MKGNTDLNLLSASNMMRCLIVDMAAANTDAQRLLLLPRVVKVLGCCGDHIRLAVKGRTNRKPRMNPHSENLWDQRKSPAGNRAVIQPNGNYNEQPTPK